MNNDNNANDKTNTKEYKVGFIIVSVICFAILSYPYISNYISTNFTHKSSVFTINVTPIPLTPTPIVMSLLPFKSNVTVNNIMNVQNANIFASGTSSQYSVYTYDPFNVQTLIQKFKMSSVNASTWENSDDSYALSVINGHYTLEHYASVTQNTIDVVTMKNNFENYLNTIFGINSGYILKSIVKSGNYYEFEVTFLNGNNSIYPDTSSDFIDMYIRPDGVLGYVNFTNFPIGDRLTKVTDVNLVPLGNALDQVYSNLNYLSVFTQDSSITDKTININTNISIEYTKIDYMANNGYVFPVFHIHLNAGVINYSGAKIFDVFFPAIDTSNISLTAQ